MTFLRSTLAAAAAAFLIASPLAAEEHPAGMHIHDVYARTMGAVGASGAAFMMIHNNSDQDDRLVGAASDVAERVELHTHKEDANGVMQMMHVPEGFPLPAGETHELARGGDHVMLMGLTRELKQGDSFSLTLTFEKAGEVTLDVTVDNERAVPAMGQGMGHMHGAPEASN